MTPALIIAAALAVYVWVGLQSRVRWGWRRGSRWG